MRKGGIWHAWDNVEVRPLVLSDREDREDRKDQTGRWMKEGRRNVVRRLSVSAAGVAFGRRWEASRMAGRCVYVCVCECVCVPGADLHGVQVHHGSTIRHRAHNYWEEEEY